MRSLSIAPLLVAAMLTGCSARPLPGAPVAIGTTARTGTFIIPTTFANGRVEFAIAGAGYPAGSVMSVPVTVQATRGTITGPLTARVLAEGFGEGGVPSEVVVRNLAVTSATIPAGQRRGTTISWDGRDEKGVLVPADAYSLVLEFRLEDAGKSTMATAGTTIQLNGP